MERRQQNDEARHLKGFNGDSGEEAGGQEWILAAIGEPGGAEDLHQPRDGKDEHVDGEERRPDVSGGAGTNNHRRCAGQKYRLCAGDAVHRLR